MPNTRFTVSTDPEIQAAIKTHADMAGMDVSAYMIAAVVAQMAKDDAASAVFASLDERNLAAAQQSAALSHDDLPAFEDLTAEEQALVRRVVGSALGSDRSDVA
jgi:hypothetical protein